MLQILDVIAAIAAIILPLMLFLARVDLIPEAPEVRVRKIPESPSYSGPEKFSEIVESFTSAITREG